MRRGLIDILRCGTAAILLAAAPSLAQLAPLPAGQGGWGAPGSAPPHPPLNPAPRDFSGYWKPVIPIATMAAT